MKKLLCILGITALLFNQSFAKANETSDTISNDTINKYELEVVQDIPNDVKPYLAENEQELIAILDELGEVFSDPGTTDSNLMENQINNTSNMSKTFCPSANMSKTFLSSPVVSNKTLTHSEDIFDLSSLGGKVVSKVNYTYSYWLAPEYYQTTVNYHDVYETGIYGLQEITYESKSAVANGATIKVNVRGRSQVYIGLSGGGASGNIVLKTFPFDKTYTIYTGLN